MVFYTSMKNLAKIDKFYFVLAIVLMFLSVVFVYAFRGIFSAFVTAYEVSVPSQQSNKIDLAKLETANNLVFEKSIPDFVDAALNPNTTLPKITPTVTPRVTAVPTTNVVQ